MNFKEKTTAKTTVRTVQGLAPNVLINSDALTKMFIYTKECSDEIGWLGTVKDLGKNNYYINDVYLFAQEVHGATTEITPEGLSAFGEEILARPDGMDIWNDLKLWGHSHVNMAVFASGQDDKQMDEFATIGHEWFIRLICNKKGDMTIDFFDYAKGIAFLDVPWYEVASDQEQTLLDQIRELNNQLETLRQTRTTSLESAIKEEMKTKVVKKQWSTVGSSKNYANAYGRYVNGVWTRWEDDEEEEKSTITPTKSASTTTDEEIGKKKTDEDEENILETDDDVMYYFTTNDLWALGAFDTLEDLNDELDFYGYRDFFTEDDMERILRVAYKVYLRYET